jgi:hypothetical protein
MLLNIMAYEKKQDHIVKVSECFYDPNKSYEDCEHLMGPSPDGYGYFNEHGVLYSDTISYVSPNNDMIKKIKDFVGNDTLLEVGAGNGFLSAILNKNGLDVISTDPRTDKSMYRMSMGKVNFIDIVNITAEQAVKTYSNANAILMSYLHTDHNYSNDTIRDFKGNKIIFIEAEGLHHSYVVSITDDYFDKDNFKLVDTYKYIVGDQEEFEHTNYTIRFFKKNIADNNLVTGGKSQKKKSQKKKSQKKKSQKKKSQKKKSQKKKSQKKKSQKKKSQNSYL